MKKKVVWEAKALVLYEKYCINCKYTRKGRKCCNKFLEIFIQLSGRLKKKSYNKDVTFSCFEKRKKC